MHHRSLCPQRGRPISRCQRRSRPGKVLRVAPIKPHAPPLVRAPVNSFEFHLRPYSPGGVLNALAAALRGGNPLTLSTHRLRRGLPGYLILFAPHAFAPQRQLQTRNAFATGVPPHLYAFHRYTWNSTLLFCTQVPQFPMTLPG